VATTASQTPRPCWAGNSQEGAGAAQAALGSGEGAATREVDRAAEAEGAGIADEAKSQELRRFSKTVRGHRAPSLQVGAVVAEPASPFGAAPIAGQAIDDLLETFLVRAEHTALDAPAAPWGDKVGYSIYDEEALLGPYVDMGQDDDDDWIDELIDGLEDGGDESLWEVEDDSPADAYAEHSDPSRLARSIRPLCCVDGLAHDLPERCPICLEGLECRQMAWRLPCTHAFHDTCMTRYLGARQARPACPVCRCDVRRLAATEFGAATP